MEAEVETLPSAMAAQIRDLDGGETFSKTIRFSPAVPFSTTEIAAAELRLERMFDNPVSRARKMKGRNYVVEKAKSFTRCGAVLITVAVTRLT